MILRNYTLMMMMMMMMMMISAFLIIINLLTNVTASLCCTMLITLVFCLYHGDIKSVMLHMSNTVFIGNKWKNAQKEKTTNCFECV